MQMEFTQLLCSSRTFQLLQPEERRKRAAVETNEACKNSRNAARARARAAETDQNRPKTVRSPLEGYGCYAVVPRLFKIWSNLQAYS